MTSRSVKNTPSPFRVIGYLDQHGKKWLRVGLNGVWAFGRRSDLVNNPSSFYARLESADVAIIEPRLRRQLASAAQAAKYEKRGHVIDRVGWHGAIYVRSGETLPRFVDGNRVIEALPVVATTATGGTFADWKAGIHQLANGQALPTFVLGCAFAALIQHLIPEIKDNVGFQLFGVSSIGKSTLLMLAAAVYGPPEMVMRKWDTTVNALEPTMAEFWDALLLLDEENLFLDTVPDAPRKLGQAIHKLASGSEKNRLDAPGKRDHRFLFLSAGNAPIAEVVKGIGFARREAVEGRMPSIPAEARKGSGVFDFLPPGCASSAEAVAQAKSFSNEHFGWAARAFIRHLEFRLANPRRQQILVASIRKNMADFKRKAGDRGSSGVASRVIDGFALVYAGAHLAHRWKVLPLDGVGSQVLMVYDRYRHASRVLAPSGAPDRSAIDLVRDYVRQHRSELHDITEREYPELSDKELDAAAGFLRTKAGVTWLMIRASKFSAEFGPSAASLLQELSTDERLKATDGNRCQVRVRKSKPKDGVYCIRVD